MPIKFTKHVPPPEPPPPTTYTLAGLGASDVELIKRALTRFLANSGMPVLTAVEVMRIERMIRIILEG